MRFLHSGKVKDVYDAGEGNLLFRFSDRVSAFDVPFGEAIPRKGEILCKFAQYWFETVPARNHFVKRVSNTEMLVKKMDMVPMECVVRGYLYGSLMERFADGRAVLPEGARPVLASKLPEPLFDPTTKAKHDVPVGREAAVGSGLVTPEQYDTLQNLSVDIYHTIHDIVDAGGFILADLKLEFGMLDGDLCLGDSIGPDECRMWPKDAYVVGHTQDAYDKQILRDWLVETGWAGRFEDDRGAGREPRPPRIPDKIIEKMTKRYAAAYERITGTPL